jgi:ABC-type sugar transport system substrate-binding protein
MRRARPTRRLHSEEQLEIQMHGDVAEVTSAPGAWEKVFDRREILLSSFAVGAGAFLLGACGGDDDSSGGGSGGSGGGGGGTPGAGKTIGISFAGLNEYVYNDLTGTLNTLKGTEYKLVVRQSSFTAEKQLADVEDLLTQQLAGLSVLPSTVQATSQAVLKAKAQGVPCVNQFWSGKTPGDSAYIGVLMTDNIVGGKLVADYVMKEVPGGGKILIVMGNVGQGYSEQFTEGIKRALKPSWSIADVQPGNYVRSDSIDAAQTMLTAHPDAKVIVSYAAEMGVAVASYLKRAGRDDVIHVTSDSNHEMIRWMSNGFIKANRYLSASETGVIPTQMLRDFIEKGQKPKQFVTRQPQRMITAADFEPKSPPPGVINEKLDPKNPAFGIYCYEDLLAEAKQLVS